MDKKGQKEYLVGTTMDCSTSQGGKVRGLKIRIIR
jgi:hypothetical protein